MLFGLRFPLPADGSGALQTCAHEYEHLCQSIQMIITTRPGTRPLAPGFGCRVHELLFQPNTPSVRAQIRFFIEQAINTWEPRLKNVSVEVGEVPEHVYEGGPHQGTTAVPVIVRFDFASTAGNSRGELRYFVMEGGQISLVPAPAT
jgi:uncharacterized protein